jgi:hypothetical protein
MIHSDLDDLESVYSSMDSQHENNRKLATIENSINELLLAEDIDNTILLRSCINPIIICSGVLTIIIVVLLVVICKKI